MSLRNPSQKMSKSSPNPKSRISISDTPDQIASKIRSAVTDSIPTISYDPVARPGVANLLTILASVNETEGETAAEVARRYEGKDHATLKRDTAEGVEARIKPIREEFTRLREDKAWLNEVARVGVRKARERAVKTMEEVKKTIGLDPF